jgi:serine/threonine-protein kinase
VLTQTQSMLGTPAYMSPEQMRSARTVDPRSDIWSLGCVLYEAVEGHPPFEASNFAELCVMVATEDPAALVSAPELGGVLMRCLAKAAEDRYQTIAEMAADLAPLSSDPTSAMHQVTRIQRLLQNAQARSDGTPLPGRQSDRRISQMAIPQMSGIAGSPLPATPPPLGPMPAIAADTVHEPRKGGSAFRTIAVLVVLFAIGIGAGLYVTRDGGQATDTQAGVPHDDAAMNIATEAPIDAAAAIEVDAREATVERESDAGSDTASGSAAPHTVPSKPPGKKPPVKKPPVKKPPVQGTGSGSASVEKPPPKKCDPFENKNGCK